MDCQSSVRSRACFCSSYVLVFFFFCLCAYCHHHCLLFNDQFVGSSDRTASGHTPSPLSHPRPWCIALAGKLSCCHHTIWRTNDFRKVGVLAYCVWICSYVLEFSGYEFNSGNIRLFMSVSQPTVDGRMTNVCYFRQFSRHSDYVCNVLVHWNFAQWLN